MTRRHIEGKELTRLDRFPDRALQRPPSLLERRGEQAPAWIPSTNGFRITEDQRIHGHIADVRPLSKRSAASYASLERAGRVTPGARRFIE
jgi:hypothetical protein